MSVRIVTVSELKTGLAAILGEIATAKAPVYVTQHGKPKAVLVDFQEYEALIEKIEDLQDILVMKDAIETPDEESVSLEEYERQRASGLRR